MESAHGPAHALFVHATGRGGVNAWPNQFGFEFGRPVEFIARRGWATSDLAGVYSFTGEAAWLADQIDAPIHLVGHSWAGVLALELALTRPDLVLSLILCEPALLSIAAHQPSVSEHVSLMKPAYDAGLTVEEFGRRFSAGYQGKEDDPATWSDDRRFAVMRLMRHEPPWLSMIDQRRLAGLKPPTLVVSSGSVEMFEAVAEAMSESPAITWRVTGGPPHRPQDGDAFNQVAQDWWNRSGP